MTPNQKKQRAEKLAEAARAAGADLDSWNLRDLLLSLTDKVDALVEQSRVRATRDLSLSELEQVLTGRGARAVARATDPAERSAGTAETSSTQGPPSKSGDAPSRASGSPGATAPRPVSGGEARKGAAISCSFCGKTNKEVRGIVSGPTSLICNECVALCSELMHEKGFATASFAVGARVAAHLDVGGLWLGRVVSDDGGDLVEVKFDVGGTCLPVKRERVALAPRSAA